MVIKELSPVQELLKEKGPSETFNLVREEARKYIYKLKEKGEISFSDPIEGEISTIHIVRKTLPEIWEATTMALMGIGQMVHTEDYDPKDKNGEYISFPSMEATTMMHIKEPFSEPRFHKHYLGGWMGFGDYIAEIEGVKDHLVFSPRLVAELIKKGKFGKVKGDETWKYSYSQRIRNYPYLDIEGNPKTINQLNSIIKKLAREPLSKSAQCTTWDPRWDHNDGQMDVKWNHYHSPCMQRLWFRLIPSEDGFKLNLNSHWRSRDHLKGVPQNTYAILEAIYEPIRLNLQESLEKPIERGRYVDISDSLHLYGHYFDPRLQGLDAESYLEDVFRVVKGEPLEGRLILPDSPMHEIMMEDIKKEYEGTKAKFSSGVPK